MVPVSYSSARNVGQVSPAHAERHREGGLPHSVYRELKGTIRQDLRERRIALANASHSSAIARRRFCESKSFASAIKFKQSAA
jgi:hypothetical protein